MRRLTRLLLIAGIAVAIIIVGVNVVSAQSRVYVAGSGDSLDLIAAYFNADRYCIAEATGLLNLNVVSAGQQLTIPYTCQPYRGQSAGRGQIRGYLLSGTAPVPGGDQGGGRYVIQPGDQLARIAQRYGITLTCLADSNGIGNVNRIFVGQELNIAACQTPASPQPISQPQPPTTDTYVVQRGDRLSDIAQRLGVDMSCLARANGIADPNRIRTGQVLDASTCRGQGGGTTITPSTYTIQRGDRLGDIARRLGVDAGCLARVNALTNANVLRVGQVLQVDPCIEQGGGIAPLPVSQIYVVQRGDRMGTIAATFGIDTDCLARVNRIASPDYLFTGETLVIDFSQCALLAG